MICSNRSGDRSIQGFAAVTALLILVAVGVLAVGASFMTITNLRLAENARTQAVARYNAELWLDVVLLAIADGYVELGVMPPRTVLDRFLIGSQQYELTRYTIDASSDGGEIQVTGLAPRGDAGASIARHPVSARFVGVESTGTGSGPGFITPADIWVSGASNLLLNMHAGGFLSVSGDVSTGDPLAGQFFSYLSGTGACSLGSAGSCLNNQAPPVVPVVDWQDRYDSLRAGTFPASDDSGRSLGPYCAVPAYPVPSGNNTTPIVAAEGDVICLPASGRFSISGAGGSLRGVTIIGGAGTQVTLTGGSSGGAIASSAEADLGVRLVAGEVVLSSGGTLNDRNEIYAAKNVILDRGVTAVTSEDIDGDGTNDVVVKTYIESARNVVFTGSGTSGTYASILANGKFCRSGNGGARFIGSITAGADLASAASLSSNYLGGGQSTDCGSSRYAIDFRGGGGWVASLPDDFDTPSAGPPQPTGIVITSRRP
jgi:hypothetical protein